jgi:hypothetical protein
VNIRPLPLPDSENKAPSIKYVWLLNLIPYLGLGYFYAVGPQAFVLVMFFIIFEVLLGSPTHLVFIYLILSVLGTAKIITKDRSTRSKLAQDHLRQELVSRELGTQIPMGQSSEFSLPTLEMKAKRAELTLKKMSANDNEESKQATDTDPFSAPSAVPAGSPPVKTETSLSNISESALSAESTASLPSSSNGSLDYSQINNSFVDSIVSNATSAATLGASAGTLEVEQMLNQEAASNAADLSIAQAGASLNSSVLDEAAVKVLLKQSDDSTDLAGAPYPVPKVSGQIAPSNSYVPAASSQYSASPADALDSNARALDISVPEVSSQWTNADASVPEVSSQWNNADTSVPEVSSQWNNAAAGVPDMNTQLQNAETNVPEVSSQWNNAETSVPDMNTQLQNAETNVPEVSSQWNTAETSVPDMNTQLQNAETNVPEVSSQWNKAETSVPDMNTQLQNAETNVPEVSSQWNKAETSVSDMNTQLQNAETNVPEISSQWTDAEASVPEVSTQWKSPEFSCPDGSTKWDGQMSALPDVVSQLANSDQTIPDVGSQLAPSSSNVPSLGDFASPKFSFSFEDHLNTSFLPADPAAQSAATVANCPKCGAVKNESFSFCLACGQAFE